MVEPELLVHATTGISLSERFTLLHAERGPPGNPKLLAAAAANTAGTLRGGVVGRSKGGTGAAVHSRAPSLLASESSVQLLELLASDPVIQRQLNKRRNQGRQGGNNNNQQQQNQPKNVKQRLGVKGRLGQKLQDRLGEVQYVRGGGGMARIRSGRGGGASRGRGQMRGSFRGGGMRGGGIGGGGRGGTPFRGGRGGMRGARGRGRGGGGGRGRGGGGGGQGGRGGRGGAGSDTKVTREELDKQLDAYMTAASSSDVIMS